MKALSVKVPYAPIIMLGNKSIEVRTRPTSYRGTLVICASLTAARLDRDHPLRDITEYYKSAPTICGHALGTVDIINCRPFTKADEADAHVPYGSDLWAWVLANPRQFKKRFPVKGQLGLFNVEVPEDILFI